VRARQPNLESVPGLVLLNDIKDEKRRGDVKLFETSTWGTTERMPDAAVDVNIESLGAAATFNVSDHHIDRLKGTLATYRKPRSPTMPLRLLGKIRVCLCVCKVYRVSLCFCVFTSTTCTQ
jgi:hypothetical protein